MASAAHQIEGAHERGPNVWDRFSAVPGTIAGGADAAVACDHYQRMADDVRLMAQLGVTSYRFSISWARAIPSGIGAPSPIGLSFYDRLIDRLLDAGITPVPTLYHWDLPVALEDAGGWPVRATATAFAEYAATVVDRFADRVGEWTTMHSPSSCATEGYLTGAHAPGRHDLGASLAAAHHLMVGHGLAVRAIRETQPDARVGITLGFRPVIPVGDSPFAHERQRITDEWTNHWFVDPIGGLGYPPFTAERLGWRFDEVMPGDMELIASPLDFLAISFHPHQFVGAFEGQRRSGSLANPIGWDLAPTALHHLLVRLHETYEFPEYVVAENIASTSDQLRTADGTVDDQDRIDHMRAHLGAIRCAIGEGVPVAGYAGTPLLDGFAWEQGYDVSSGLFEVDRDTLERRPKVSSHWFSEVANTGYVPPAP